MAAASVSDRSSAPSSTGIATPRRPREPAVGAAAQPARRADPADVPHHLRGERQGDDHRDPHLVESGGHARSSRDGLASELAAPTQASSVASRSPS